ncbi:hypothetical protein [Faecalimonas sp.]
MALLKFLYQCSSENIVDMQKFLSLYPDTQELRSELKVLDNLGYIRVMYASGKIYEICFLENGIDYVKNL